MCQLTEDEIAAVAEHEHVPEIIALEMGNYLCVTAEGERRISAMIVEDIEAARSHGNFAHAAKLRRVLQHFLEHHGGVVLTDEQKEAVGFSDDFSFLSGQSMLLTDLYQLNMLQAYRDADMDRTAVFEFFVRRLPARRGFLISAGLATIVAFLEQARFSDDDLTWLEQCGRFDPKFVESLADWRFTGDVDAMDEGRVFFPCEPVIRVTAPLSQAQLIETRLINLLHLQIVIASKAARFALAAPDRTLIDFGLRRAHGAEAGLLAARSAYLAGFTGSATMLAERQFGVPAYGTMAHSFIQAHESETAAFRHFGNSRPDHAIFLIDTYDTERGAAKIVDLAKQGLSVRGVRLDSGDLAVHARTVRQILDAGGLGDVRIFASGGLNEDQLLRFSKDDTPIDGYGIGTNLTTSEDAPALDCAYKLQAYDGMPKRKRSEGKATWPGCKQVYRQSGRRDVMVEDIVTLVDAPKSGEPMLGPVMRAGQRVGRLPTLHQARQRAADDMSRLPPRLRGLETEPPYPVRIATELKSLAAKVDREHSKNDPGTSRKEGRR
jgi:nicotinate phosphoribosyltransferase